MKDNSGWYHIDTNGTPIYTERYTKAFGFYNSRAAVIAKDRWFHINTNGSRVYSKHYKWCGNYQEEICSVRTKNGAYFHINLDGKKCYPESYHYAGDFKYGFACVMNDQQLFTHINKAGKYLHGKWFLDLGVYHKGFATTRDASGWFHIDFKGKAIYEHRLKLVEPFYNGWAFGETKNGRKCIVSEEGEILEF